MMSRLSQWQRIASDKVSWQQDKANSATIYILREIGPTSFLLKEDGFSKNLKISLGDPHNCTCSYFQKEQTPCKHICWILLKRFKLNRFDDLSFQYGLVEREINIILSKFNSSVNVINSEIGSIANNLDDECRNIPENKLQQRVINDDDLCPICQEKLLIKHQPVTYCRYGCGNSVHIKCMKIWTDHLHRSAGNEKVFCPFCRQEFADMKILMQEFRNIQQEIMLERLDQHRGFACDNCQMNPIRGKCYKCLSCKNLYLCNHCFHSNCHSHHQFLFRLRSIQQWKKVKCQTSNVEALGNSFHGLQSREITENDYDLLLQLDRESKTSVDLAGLPDHVIRSLPLFQVKKESRLLKPGYQCRLCLRCYSKGDYVRRLPDCGHTFHQLCLDDWFRNDHRRCPVDRIPVVMHRRIVGGSSDRNFRENIESKDDTNNLCLPGISNNPTKDARLDRKQTRMVEGKCRNLLYHPNNEVDQLQIQSMKFQQTLPSEENLSTFHLPAVLGSRNRHKSSPQKKVEQMKTKENEKFDISHLALQGTRCMI